MKDVSVVIPICCPDRELITIVDRLIRQTYNIKEIILDNANDKVYYIKDIDEKSSKILYHYVKDLIVMGSYYNYISLKYLLLRDNAPIYKVPQFENKLIEKVHTYTDLNIEKFCAKLIMVRGIQLKVNILTDDVYLACITSPENIDKEISLYIEQFKDLCVLNYKSGAAFVGTRYNYTISLRPSVIVKEVVNG